MNDAKAESGKIVRRCGLHDSVLGPQTSLWRTDFGLGHIRSDPCPIRIVVPRKFKRRVEEERPDRHAKLFGQPDVKPTSVGVSIRIVYEIGHVSGV